MIMELEKTEKCRRAGAPPLGFHAIPQVPALGLSRHPARHSGQQTVGEDKLPTLREQGSACLWEGKQGETTLQRHGNSIGQNGEGTSVFGES